MPATSSPRVGDLIKPCFGKLNALANEEEQTAAHLVGPDDSKKLKMFKRGLGRPTA